MNGLADRAHQADGEHANGEAEKGAEDDLLAEQDLNFPEEADRDCDYCGDRIISILKNVESELFSRT